MLSVRAISKSYDDVQALRGADLDVESGQIVALLGKNGAGKTTMISIIAGLLAPDSGSVHIDGLDVFDNLDAAAKKTGIAPQDTGIYGVLTVRENLEFFANLAGIARRERASASAAVAERLGLSHLLDRRAGKLSGGEQRRLHTGCALVHRPQLLMLDEPTVGADVATRAQLIETVREMADEGAAVIYTTHYLTEVESLDADIVIIDDGAILARGSREELIQAHRLKGLEFRLESALESVLRSELAAVEVSPLLYRTSDDLSIGELIQRLGPVADSLLGVEMLRPDLETVFLEVTGDRLANDEEVS
ncbi:MAG: ABC transporter ATP-binding protein [Acidimicrobiales bacterium]